MKHTAAVVLAVFSLFACRHLPAQSSVSYNTVTIYPTSNNTGTLTAPGTLTFESLTRSPTAFNVTLTAPVGPHGGGGAGGTSGASAIEIVLPDYLPPTASSCIPTVYVATANVGTMYCGDSTLLTSQSIIPEPPSTISLGDSVNLWNFIYVNNVITNVIGPTTGASITLNASLFAGGTFPTYDLGGPAHEFNNVYAVNGSFSTVTASGITTGSGGQMVCVTSGGLFYKTSTTC